jgi:hypothetical protein
MGILIDPLISCPVHTCHPSAVITDDTFGGRITSAAVALGVRALLGWRDGDRLWDAFFALSIATYVAPGLFLPIFKTVKDKVLLDERFGGESAAIVDMPPTRRTTALQRMTYGKALLPAVLVWIVCARHCP